MVFVELIVSSKVCRDQTPNSPETEPRNNKQRMNNQQHLEDLRDLNIALKDKETQSRADNLGKPWEQ